MVRDPETAEAAGAIPRQLSHTYLREDKGKTCLRNWPCRPHRPFCRPRSIRRYIRDRNGVGPSPCGFDARQEATEQRGRGTYRCRTRDGSEGRRGHLWDRGPQRGGISIPGKEEGRIQRKVMRL